jgi:hypothetical protein
MDRLKKPNPERIISEVEAACEVSRKGRNGVVLCVNYLLRFHLLGYFRPSGL